LRRRSMRRRRCWRRRSNKRMAAREGKGPLLVWEERVYDYHVWVLHIAWRSSIRHSESPISLYKLIDSGVFGMRVVCSACAGTGVSLRRQRTLLSPTALGGPNLQAPRTCMWIRIVLPTQHSHGSQLSPAQFPPRQATCNANHAFQRIGARVVHPIVPLTEQITRRIKKMS
jgi:hypothetical protein